MLREAKRVNFHSMVVVSTVVEFDGCDNKVHGTAAMTSALCVFWLLLHALIELAHFANKCIVLCGVL